MKKAKEIAEEILFEKAERITRDILEKVREKKQGKFTVDEMLGLIGEIYPIITDWVYPFYLNQK